MPVYRVYYSAEFTQREFFADIYVVVEASDRMAGLRQAFDLRPQAVKWGMIEERHTDEPEGVLPDKLPWNKTSILNSIKAVMNPTPAPDTVRVSFWDTGTRAGKFSSRAYPVLARDTEKNTVTVELMPGKPKTVSEEQVQAA